MARTSKTISSPLKALSVIIAVAMTYVLYVGAAEPYQPVCTSTRLTSRTRLNLSHQRKLSRMQAQIRAIKYSPDANPAEGCFATTEDQARDNLIQAIRKAEPDLWGPATDFSNWLPSASSFVCTEGLRPEEVDGITAALNTHTHARPRLSLDVKVENAPETDEGHSIIQDYLGRERYIEHMATCLRKTQSENRDANAKLDRTMAQLLNLSAEQQKALKPIQVRLIALNGPAPTQALDENGSLVTLDDRPHMEREKALQALLDIAERGFSIQTAEQARAYRDLATGAAYGEVLAQYKLTQAFLPIPEEIREIIRSMEAPTTP